MEQQEIDQIKKEARTLLDKFSKALEKVKTSEESNVIRVEDRRKEGQGTNCDSGFRNAMLENAPNKDEDFIIAEKKSW